MIGPKTLFSQYLHSQKYRTGNESFREAMNRIAAELKDNDEHYSKLREILLDMRFMFAGRIQAVIGTTKNVTPFNCFVSGEIRDSFVDGSNSIMQMVTEAVRVMRLGGGIGYNFSTLRPYGDLIKSIQSYSTGPVNLMGIFDAACAAIKSSGHRRGAQMGVLRVDHPDIERFVMAKQPDVVTQMLWDAVGKMSYEDRIQLVGALQQTFKLTNFNLSVGITDEFMRCLLYETPFTLRFNGKKYREVDPIELYERIMRTTWDWGEPGVLFIDTINRLNNLHYCETITATNPCGEQPLPPYGACALGSFNLTKYLISNGRTYYFDFEQFCADIPVIVRAMDNVFDKAIYPSSYHQVEALNKRRMGLGVTGLANTGEALGFAYGSSSFVSFTCHVLETLNEIAYITSSQIASDKGSFALFEKQYLEGHFIKRLPDHIRDLIKENGIRNSHLTSIAPTGTISLCADNISSGIEPVYAYKCERQITLDEVTQTIRQSDYGYSELGVNGKVSDRVTIDEHLNVLISAANRVDSAVSKTLNVSSDVGWDAFKNIYKKVWEHNVKGCTTFRAEGKRLGILASTESLGQCNIDPVTGKKDCD